MSLRLAVVGHPVAHSRSPRLHQAWLDDLGIEGHYGTVDVEVLGLRPDTLLDHLEAQGMHGVNLTVPCKRWLLDQVDVDPVALRVGALNTLVRTEVGWRGTNTDVAGFAAAARSRDADLHGPVVVLGAGGAARAVVAALPSDAEVRIANRTLAHAESLVEALGIGEVVPWGDAMLDGATVVVNALSGAGIDRVRQLDPTRVAPGTVWMDLNYWCDDPPLRTELLDRGCTFDEGYGMLLHQGALAFEAFTGLQPNLTVGMGVLFALDACDKIAGGG